MKTSPPACFIALLRRCTATGLLAALVLLFPGCQWPDSMLAGNAVIQTDIRSRDIGRILFVTNQQMRRIGYSVSPDTVPQEGIFAPARPDSANVRMWAFINGGTDRIWIVAQPLGNGWTLSCMPEPGGTDTSFPRFTLRALLQKIKKECESQRLTSD